MTTTPFELEWLGGATEHFFRRARPDVDKVPWGTVDTSRYAPELLAAVRGSWTELSMNETFQIHKLFSSRVLTQRLDRRIHGPSHTRHTLPIG